MTDPRVPDGDTMEGYALKKKRKKGQGYGKRWFQLDPASGCLSYSYKAHGHVRESCHVSTASLGFDQTARELILDSGRAAHPT
jgi:hypothetical protein